MIQADSGNNTTPKARTIRARVISAHQRPTLADDAILHAGRDGWTNRQFDPDFELFTWPECINQSLIGEAAFGRFADDDMELDDGL